MISHMVKPEEVLVVENEQGEAVREFMKDTYAITMYKTMRETLGKQAYTLLTKYSNRAVKVVVHFLACLCEVNCFVVYLTHLDYADTEELMTQKLYRQVDNTEWSWKNLNTVGPHTHMRARAHTHTHHTPHHTTHIYHLIEFPNSCVGLLDQSVVLCMKKTRRDS